MMKYLLRNKRDLDFFVINGRHAIGPNLDFYPSIKSSRYSISSLLILFSLSHPPYSFVCVNA